MECEGGKHADISRWLPFISRVLVYNEEKSQEKHYLKKIPQILDF
jgi:hypothetical protein